MAPAAPPQQGWFDPRSGPLGPGPCPLLLIGAAVLGACLIFGYSSFVVGFVLLAAGGPGLIVFMNTPGAVRRPGEGKTIIEKHFMGNADHHRNYRT